MPLLMASLLVTSLSGGVIAGAISGQGFLKFIDTTRESPSSTDRKEEQKQSSEKDKNRNDRTVEKKQVTGSTPEVGSQTLQPTAQNQTTAPAQKVIKSSPTAKSTAVAASNPSSVPSAPPDTSTASVQLSSEQAKKSVKPIYYESSRISNDKRDDLLNSSLLGIGVASLLYASSYAGTLWRLFYGEPISVRRPISRQN